MEKAPTETVRPSQANATIEEKWGIAKTSVPQLMMENPTKAARPKVKATKAKARARARLQIPPLEKLERLCLPRRRRGGLAPHGPANAMTRLPSQQLASGLLPRRQ